MENFYKLTSNHKSFVMSSEDFYNLNQYVIEYKRGEEVEKIKDTLGLFCFDNFMNMMRFLETETKEEDEAKFEIKLVKPLSEGTKREEIPEIGCIDDFYTKKHCEWQRQTPPGTILFDKIQIIGEYCFEGNDELMELIDEVGEDGVEEYVLENMRYEYGNRN